MALRRPLPLPHGVIERWNQHVEGEVTHLAEATGFVNFELSFDGPAQRRVVTPEHYVVTFNVRDKNRQRLQGSLLTLRIVQQDDLPDQVQVGVEVRGRDGESVICSGEYLEFELLSQSNDASRQPPLKICAGPVRINGDNGQREFMRIDLGRCVRQIITDSVDDPKHKGQKLSRNRWWICLEVLKLVCRANDLDCSGLDDAGVKPLEWVLCLVDEKGASPAPEVAQKEKSIDELAKFIDAGSGGKKKAKKKKSKGDATVGDDDADADDPNLPETEQVSKASAALAALVSRGGAAGFGSGGYPAAPQHSAGVAPPVLPGAGTAVSSTAPVPGSRSGPPQGRRAVDVAPALLGAWRDLAGGDKGELMHVAEATGFVHFVLSCASEKCKKTKAERCFRAVAPTHYVVAFPQMLNGQQKFHSGFLTLRIVRDADVPEIAEGGTSESAEFELLAHPNEAPVQVPLRFTAGPVRINPKTGQRESMRLDLGDCVRWAMPDYVDRKLQGSTQRLVRQRWWLSLETLRLICYANQLDASGLEVPGAAPLEWIACLVDERTPVANGSGAAFAAACTDQASVAEPPRGNGIAGQHAAVDGGGGAGKKGKKKNKASGGESSETPAAEKQSSPKVSAASSAEAAKSEAQAAKTAKPSQGSPVAAASSTVTAAAASAEPKPAKPAKQPAPSRALALPSALIDSWCQFAKKSVTHIAEATGFVHFLVSCEQQQGSRKTVVSPEHYIVAFHSRDKGKPRHHSALLSMRVVKHDEIPPEHLVPAPKEDCRGDVEYVEFELFARPQEAHVAQQLRITAGPVRTNPTTGQRESMRIDLGRCVRQIATDVVDDPRSKRVVRSRWWICMETLRMICNAHELDCSALDERNKPPMEWVLCLVDETRADPPEAKAPPNTAGAPEEACADASASVQDLDELVDFIDGKASSKKKKKSKARQTGGGEAGAGDPASSVGPLAAPTVLDPVLRAQAAAQLLAECAASGVSPQQQEALAEAALAARRAAEVVAADQQQQLQQPTQPAVASSLRRPSAAELLRANRGTTASLASGMGKAAAPSSGGKTLGGHRTMLGGWEPTPLFGSQDVADPLSLDRGSPGESASLDAAATGAAALRALDGLMGLESLLANLRTEFTERTASLSRSADLAGAGR
eukprot:TRINITY_DN23252_c0_g2_i1.p1 TRINITY_DN23252_c0_g2~~TRINITY_DN23252_c0_g2_i1.p1  ORF type:complete len:1146 (-),score=304.95 TRINITY_DN23252_c0_g2_i1:19-3456(-)